jgi:5-methyltetrahydrofolate--homocysteine methyltransferase
MLQFRLHQTINEEQDMELTELYNAVIEGDAPQVQAGVKAAMNQGVAADVILNQALIAAMNEVGRRYEEGEFFVPEMLISARAMQSGLSLLKPALMESGIEAAGKIAIGTVKGDLHDIGKNLVAMMLEGAGYEVQDLGVDVTPQAFVDAVKGGAQVVGMSALLTTTMSNMKNTIQALEEAGVRDQVKVVIGGAPVTHEFSRQIGADAYAPDASTAVRTVRQLVAAS